MKKGIVISGGSLDLDFARAYLERESFDGIIAADRGVMACEALSLRPDLIVGDFDSAGEDARLRWRASGIEMREFNPVKDWTDTEIAVTEGIRRGWKQITVLGGTGTRLDHELGNLQTMVLANRQGADCILADEHNRIYYRTAPFGVRKEAQWGNYISFFAFGGPVKGLTLQGFAYDVEDFWLTECGSRTVSNEILSEEASVSFQEGALLVIESRD